MIFENRFHYPKDFLEQSKKVLDTALNSVPAYQPWRKLDLGSNANINDRYDAIPVLTKQMIREGFPLGLMPKEKDLNEGLLSEEIEYTFTSGTTGDRVINIWDQNWWNQAEEASWKLNSTTSTFNYPEKEAKLASSLNVGISCEEDLPYSSRIVGKKLYLNEKINIIQWQDRHYARMVEELSIFQPVILEANPSLLTRLCYWIIDRGIEIFNPKVIVFTYEFISKIHLRAIKKVFSCPTISSYGTTETGFVLMECENGLLHQNTEFCRIDFHPLKDCYGGPNLGRMLVTTFRNPWNIVIKFDTGDLVRLNETKECGCGRNEGMIVKYVEGRTSNSTFSEEMKPITTKTLDDKLSLIDTIRDYSMVQTSLNEYELTLMIEKDSPPVIDDVTDFLKELYGNNGKFNIKVVENILPGPAGKFKRTGIGFDYDWNNLFV